jgi:hypothetical protein
MDDWEPLVLNGLCHFRGRKPRHNAIAFPVIQPRGRRVERPRLEEDLPATALAAVTADSLDDAAAEAARRLDENGNMAGAPPAKGGNGSSSRVEKSGTNDEKYHSGQFRGEVGLSPCCQRRGIGEVASTRLFRFLLVPSGFAFRLAPFYLLSQVWRFSPCVWTCHASAPRSH